MRANVDTCLIKWSISHLIAAENHGNVLAHAHKVAMPVGDVLIGHTGGNIKHDDGALKERKRIINGVFPFSFKKRKERGREKRRR